MSGPMARGVLTDPAAAGECPVELASASPLSARETEILHLLAEGYTSLNIAMRLNLSHATARNHVANIIRKLDVHSQVQAISTAFRRGWLT